MTICPKCGFKNERPQAADCPKCGLIYAKYQKAKTNEAQHISAERALGESLRNAISSDSSNSSEDVRFNDFEERKDQSTYPAINFLSWFFIIFSCILTLVWAACIKSFWSFLATNPYTQGGNNFLFTLLFAITTFVPIAGYLALSGALKLGKDIADNTRATRNYLSHIAKKMK